MVSNNYVFRHDTQYIKHKNVLLSNYRPYESILLGTEAILKQIERKKKKKEEKREGNYKQEMPSYRAIGLLQVNAHHRGAK